MKRVAITFIAVFALFVRGVHASGEIEQHTIGWCSPAVANIKKGNVQIVCYGVDPKALKRLNELLDLKDAQLKQNKMNLKQKIKEAEEWAAKYRELKSRLNQADDSKLSKQAEKLLAEGEFEKAGAILDKIIQKEEKEQEKLAENHYNRGGIFLLEFKPLEALPHFKKAYSYNQNNLKFANAYVSVLLEQNNFKDAEFIYKKNLEKWRGLAQKNPDAYLPYVAETLNNLGNLYWKTQRFNDAEDAYKEALEIRRGLAQKNPDAYLPDVAEILNNLGLLCSDTQRFNDAEDAYKEALKTYRGLAQKNPDAYLPDLAQTLNNLGFLYWKTQRFNDAEDAYKEALKIERGLAQKNPDAYLPILAHMLNNLGNLYKYEKRSAEADAAYSEACYINKNLAKYKNKK